MALPPTASAALRYWNMARQRHCRRLARNGKPAASLLTPSSSEPRTPAGKARVLDARKWLRERDGLSAGGRWIRTLGPPVRRIYAKGSPPIASTGGADRRENGESADLAPSLRHPKLVERLDGVRDAAGENSGCGVALQVLGSLPVRSSRPFIGEIPRKTRAGSTVPVSSDKDGRAAKGGGHGPRPRSAPH